MCCCNVLCVCVCVCMDVEGGGGALNVENHHLLQVLLVGRNVFFLLLNSFINSLISSFDIFKYYPKTRGDPQFYGLVAPAQKTSIQI